MPLKNSIFFCPVICCNSSQSTPAGWEDNVKDILQTGQEVRAQSCQLRALLDGPIFSDCVQDLRAQADKVDRALARRVAEIDLCRQALENELLVVSDKNNLLY